MLNITLIIPPVVTHNADPHTGIPFLPHMAAYLAGTADKLGHNVEVIDCFGNDSNQIHHEGEFIIIGQTGDEIKELINDNTDIFFIYCKVIEDLFSVEKILKYLKKNYPHIKVCLFENIQTTNSFSLKKINEYLFEKGCDFIFFGEPEAKLKIFLDSFRSIDELNKIKGIAFKNNKEIIVTEDEPFNNNLDSIPFPLWKKFNMNGYWNIGYSHAPVKKGSRFLPLITSRGCPYRCKFCVSPTLNPKWRSRSAKNVVDEIEHLYKSLKITDFHVSDLDPTVNEKRTIEIAEEIINRKINITWKISQGTKIETIKNISTIETLKKSGLKFFSFSPESGSKKLMEKLNKPFDFNHAIKILKELVKAKIKSQACFIIGTPPETKIDRKLTFSYMTKLAKIGVDEIAVFIYSPIPGSYFADEIGGFKHYSQLSRSPTWRKDYKKLKRFRMKMYLSYILIKALYHPIKLLKNLSCILNGKFETKMEMAIFKLVKLKLILIKSKLT
jgi:organic radical activating enzyme